jgi:hypothetical protein
VTSSVVKCEVTYNTQQTYTYVSTALGQTDSHSNAVRGIT